MQEWVVTGKGYKGTFQSVRNILTLDIGRGYKGLERLKLHMFTMNRPMALHILTLN